MALTSLFTETPIEAALWHFSVSLQEKLAESLFQNPVFKGFVALYMGYRVAKSLARMGSNSENIWLPLAGKILCCLIGLSMLGNNSSEAFKPESESGTPWAVRTSQKSNGRFSGLRNEAHGLKFYTLISGAMNAISTQVSSSVAGVFGDSASAKSPRLLLQTLHETARHTIDDPEVLETIDALYESCTKTSTASSQVAYASLSNQFDLAKENCSNMHSILKSKLDSWARNRIALPGSQLVAFAEAARNNSLMRTLGFDDNEALKNKVIASGVQDYLFSRSGKSLNNVSNSALLGNEGLTSDSLGASTWVNFSRMLTLGGIANLTLRPFTGTDYEAADARNDIANLYTKVSVFLPAIRGFAKGILALMFLVAAARMAFGSTNLMQSWLWCLVLFTAYEPLSTFLYQATITLTQSPETTEAMGALARDPLVLVGAQVIDSYASKVQATYFVLQMGLTALTAAGGLSVFRYQRALGGSLAGAISAKGMNLARTVVMAKTGGAAAAARGMAAGAAASKGGSMRG